jgi:hypothetical protein
MRLATLHDQRRDKRNAVFRPLRLASDQNFPSKIKIHGLHVFVSRLVIRL